MKASFMARCHPCGHCPWQLIHDDINPPRRVRDSGPQDVVGRVPSRGGTFVVMYSLGPPPLTIETDDEAAERAEDRNLRSLCFLGVEARHAPALQRADTLSPSPVIIGSAMEQKQRKRTKASAFLRCSRGG